jgi:putative flippase GtrA
VNERHTSRRRVAAGAARHAWRALFREQARPVRFAIVGGLAGLMQLALLKLLIDHGWQALLANGVAFLLSAQCNFVMSCLFTWRDRGIGGTSRSGAQRDGSTTGGMLLVARRWLAFHCSIASMALVNMVAFAVAQLVLPNVAAAAVGICVAAIGNFFIGDRLIFRSRQDDRSRRGHTPARRAAA